MALYTKAFRRLCQVDAVYPCYCSRADIAEAASAPTDAFVGYSGKCRDESGRAEQRRKRPDALPAYRFRVEAETLSVDDGVIGRATFTLQAWRDDFVVWRSDQIPAYHLAVVVDDAAMQIGEIVRGEDLLSCTPYHMLLYRALACAQPRYAHVPVWRDAHGAKLAKRNASSGLAAMREADVSPTEVAGMLAASCGLVPPGTACSPRDLVGTFQPSMLRTIADASSSSMPHA